MMLTVAVAIVPPLTNVPPDTIEAWTSMVSVFSGTSSLVITIGSVRVRPGPEFTGKTKAPEFGVKSTFAANKRQNIFLLPAGSKKINELLTSKTVCDGCWVGS